MIFSSIYNFFNFFARFFGIVPGIPLMRCTAVTSMSHWFFFHVSRNVLLFIKLFHSHFLSVVRWGRKKNIIWKPFGFSSFFFFLQKSDMLVLAIHFEFTVQENVIFLPSLAAYTTGPYDEISLSFAQFPVDHFSYPIISFFKILTWRQFIIIDYFFFSVCFTFSFFYQVFFLLGLIAGILTKFINLF